MTTDPQLRSGSVAFDRAAGFYDQTRGFPAGQDEPVAAFVARAGGLQSDDCVLEIGVGTGRIALPLAPYVRAYVGLDLSLPMMQRLQAKRTSQTVYLAQGDATRLPFAAGSFDAAVAVHVFHLIPSWKDALHELARVLRPGARLLHCWGGGDPVFRVLRDMLDDMRADTPDRVALPGQQNMTFLKDEGWQPVGDEHIYTYHYYRKPQGLVEQIQQRVWSGTWELSDEALAERVAAVQAAVNAQFPNPLEPVRVEATFHAAIYRPPAT